MADDPGERSARIRIVLDQLRELIPEQGGTLEVRGPTFPTSAVVVGDDVAVLRLGQALLNEAVSEKRVKGIGPLIKFSSSSPSEHVGIVIGTPSKNDEPRTVDVIRALNQTLILITVLHVLILILVISTLLVVSTGRTG